MQSIIIKCNNLEFFFFFKITVNENFTGFDAYYWYCDFPILCQYQHYWYPIPIASRNILGGKCCRAAVTLQNKQTVKTR